MYIRAFHLVFALMVGSAATVAQQQPFPTYTDSAQWSVTRSFWGMPFGTEVIRYSGDTIMCDHSYSVVPNGGPIWFGPGYFRNEGQRTMFRTTTNCEGLKSTCLVVLFGTHDPMHHVTLKGYRTRPTLQDIVHQIKNRRIAFRFDQFLEQRFLTGSGHGASFPKCKTRRSMPYNPAFINFPLASNLCR